MEFNIMLSQEHLTNDHLQKAKRHAKDLLHLVSGVQGIGIGSNTLRVYIRDATVTHYLPDEIWGVAVEPVVVGEVTCSNTPIKPY